MRWMCGVVDLSQYAVTTSGAACWTASSQGQLVTAPAWCSKLQRREMDQLSWAALLAYPWSGSLPGRAALQLQQQCVLQHVMGARHRLCRPVVGTKRRQHICMLYRLSQCSAVASSGSGQCVLLPEHQT